MANLPGTGDRRSCLFFGYRFAFLSFSSFWEGHRPRRAKQTLGDGQLALGDLFSGAEKIIGRYWWAARRWTVFVTLSP